jgi:hypothetical protein
MKEHPTSGWYSSLQSLTVFKAYDRGIRSSFSRGSIELGAMCGACISATSSPACAAEQGTRSLGRARSVFLDRKLISKVGNIGVPLDVLGVGYSGISPAIPGATGENLRSKINSFTIGHGTFSLLDAFPYQWGWFDVCTGGPPDALTTAACGLSVSIPKSERLFGGRPCGGERAARGTCRLAGIRAGVSHRLAGACRNGEVVEVRPHALSEP